METANLDTPRPIAGVNVSPSFLKVINCPEPHINCIELQFRIEADELVRCKALFVPDEEQVQAYRERYGDDSTHVICKDWDLRLKPSDALYKILMED